MSEVGASLKVAGHALIIGQFPAIVVANGIQHNALVQSSTRSGRDARLERLVEPKTRTTAIRMARRPYRHPSVCLGNCSDKTWPLRMKTSASNVFCPRT